MPGVPTTPVTRTSARPACSTTATPPRLGPTGPTRAVTSARTAPAAASTVAATGLGPATAATTPTGPAPMAATTPAGLARRACTAATAPACTGAGDVRPRRGLRAGEQAV